jgi:hypothetical protein
MDIVEFIRQLEKEYPNAKVLFCFAKGEFFFAIEYPDGYRETLPFNPEST